ncbi:MAG: chemotaxis protein CheC [Synergistaceae bacterium]|nr:chemotaxis protein CheC [Synergistaceae bacterium]MBQ4418990.1 chemotaxis protein CheC [Synergistaceae bacterium]MBQ6910100.1 chemotaxis protein CheC [Synergistaceae bacterium]MBR0043415.1 chemotaxis protein CheC [Synergistaceae bacterium]MBR0220272.1 chemotaxis protein CheC [Synergistaceae bacterium]
MIDLGSFSSLQLDAIREVGNIGTGNAATALSKLLSCMINMDVPKAELVSIYELAEHYGDPGREVAAVFVRSLGGFGCSLIFVQQEEDAQLMVDLLLKQQFGDYLPENLPQEMRDSALTEVGNIILSSFLNAINLLIGTQHQISVPAVAHDMLSSILDVVASIFGQMGEMALMINTQLRVEGAGLANISGSIILVPDPDALEMLLRKLRVL